MTEQLGRPSSVRSYELPPSRYRMSKGFTITLAVLLVLIVMFALMSPCGGGMSRAGGNRAKSSSNMHQIGLALLMYSNVDPHGRFAPDLPALVTSQELSPDVFVDPSTNDTRAPGNTPAEWAANLMKGGYESYIYVGATLTNDSPPDAVALYEPLAANKNAGSNVLFADGHVDFLDQPAVEQIIQMYRANIRPIYWPPHLAPRR
ncbi:MAG TPA: H-X9-DG-CTERM domain-containing protein [Tepidisphaeraceae bacterium]|jgi:prepilin-type processing-associated H-X9-DG protein|nr:H-X9-DG-CTERM domain-containing protein [Tepidisphaeraceae bacterium]